jgi:hypothetical protein
MSENSENSVNSVNNFNINLELLLKNILNNFKELHDTITGQYTIPLDTDSYIQSFINMSKHKFNDISNKNEIIFSKGVTIIEHIDFNYIWSHENVTNENKDIIWKYLQTMVLYSIEYNENINIKTILKQYKHDNIIHNDSQRMIINILDNLSNKKIINDTYDSDDTTDKTNDAQTFKLPDLSGIVGKELMNLINKTMDSIDLNSVEIGQPLELVQTLLDGSFSLETDTTGVAKLVKQIIDNLKINLLSKDLNRKVLFKDLENVLQLVNSITNNNKDINKIFDNLQTNEFYNNFDTIINSLDFEQILKYIIDILQKVQSESSININEVLEKLGQKFSDGSLSAMGDMSSMGNIMGLLGNFMNTSNNSNDTNDTSNSTTGGLGDMGNIMGLLGNFMNTSNNSNDTNDTNDTSNSTTGGLGDISKLLSSLNINNIVENVMTDMNIDSNQSDEHNNANIDMNELFKSVTKNLPNELMNNMSQNNPSDLLNKLSGDIDFDQLKQMIGVKKNTRMNHTKINQLSRLEKRRDRLRKKLAERKRLLQK